MPKLTWNKFVEKHAANVICVFTTVALPIPKGYLAADSRKLPTARAMLVEGLGKLIAGDWAFRPLPSRKAKNGKAATPIHIILTDPTDIKRLASLFEILPGQGSSALCSVSLQFFYEFDHYKRLGMSLGYFPANKPGR